MQAESTDERDSDTTVFVGFVPNIRKPKETIPEATAFYSHNNEEIKEGE